MPELATRLGHRPCGPRIYRIQRSRMARDHLVVRTPGNPTFHWGNCVLVTDPEAVEESEDGSRSSNASSRQRPGQPSAFPACPRTDLVGRARPGARARRRARDGPPSAPDPASGSIFGTPARKRRGLGAGRRAGDGGERANGAVPEALHETFLRARRRADAGLSNEMLAAFFGAFADDALAASLGIVLCGRTARYQNVGTDEPHRRRGLASHLLGVAASWAADRGCDRWVIVTESTNSAGRVYRAVGFEPARGRSRPTGVPDEGRRTLPRARGRCLRAARPARVRLLPVERQQLALLGSRRYFSSAAS